MMNEFNLRGGKKPYYKPLYKRNFRAPHPSYLEVNVADFYKVPYIHISTKKGQVSLRPDDFHILMATAKDIHAALKDCETFFERHALMNVDNNIGDPPEFELMKTPVEKMRMKKKKRKGVSSGKKTKTPPAAAAAAAAAASSSSSAVMKAMMEEPEEALKKSATEDTQDAPVFKNYTSTESEEEEEESEEEEEEGDGSSPAKTFKKN